MGRVPGVSAGGYYGWARRPPCAPQQWPQGLAAEIRAIHREVKAGYGSPRVHAELVARGRPCGVNTVARLMRRHGVSAEGKRKFRCTTDSNHGRPVAEDLLARQFEPTAADRAR